MLHLVNGNLYFTNAPNLLMESYPSQMLPICLWKLILHKCSQLFDGNSQPFQYSTICVILEAYLTIFLFAVIATDGGAGANVAPVSPEFGTAGAMANDDSNLMTFAFENEKYTYTVVIDLTLQPMMDAEG